MSLLLCFTNSSLSRTSTLRDKTASTLSHLDAKYNTSNGNANNVGGKRKKAKVFDDDLSEEDEETIVRGEDGCGMDSDAQDGENSEDDSEEDSEDDSEEEDEEEDEEDEEEEEDEEPQDRPAPAKPTRTTLDPLASLQASKFKEVMKGRAILRQQVRQSLPPHNSLELMDCIVEIVRRAVDCSDYVSKGVGGWRKGAVTEEKGERGEFAYAETLSGRRTLPLTPGHELTSFSARLLRRNRRPDDLNPRHSPYKLPRGLGIALRGLVCTAGARRAVSSGVYRGGRRSKEEKSNG